MTKNQGLYIPESLVEILQIFLKNEDEKVRYFNSQNIWTWNLDAFILSLALLVGLYLIIQSTKYIWFWTFVSIIKMM